MSSLLIAILGGGSALFFWGISNYISKVAVDEAGADSTGIWGQLIRLLLKVPIVILFPVSFALSTEAIVIAIVIGIIDALGVVIYFRAMEVGKASMIAPVMSSYTIVAVIISYFVFSEPFTWLKLVGIVVVIIGIVLTVVDLTKLKDGFQKSDLMKGVPLAIALMFIWGVFVPFWDHIITPDTFISLAIVVELVNLILLAIYHLAIKKHKIGYNSLGRKVFVWIVIMVVLDTIGGIGFDLGLSLSEHTSITSALSSASPLVVVILSFVFLKERLGKLQYVGVAVLISGVMLLAAL